MNKWRGRHSKSHVLTRVADDGRAGFNNMVGLVAGFLFQLANGCLLRRFPFIDQTCWKFCGMSGTDYVCLTAICVPTMYLSIGGRYCSIMTVEGGKEFFLDLRIASIATAVAHQILAGATIGGAEVPSTPLEDRVLRSAISQGLYSRLSGSHGGQERDIPPCHLDQDT